MVHPFSYLHGAFCTSSTKPLQIIEPLDINVVPDNFQAIRHEMLGQDRAHQTDANQADTDGYLIFVSVHNAWFILSLK
jgi:hypothetical protein